MIRPALVAVFALGLFACGSSGSSSSTDDTDQGALIPTKAFTASCEMSVVKDTKTIKGYFTGSFNVSTDGKLSGTKDPLYVSIGEPGRKDHQLVVKSGKVIDAQNDIMDFVATETILNGKVQTFDVTVHYDGTKKKIDVDSIPTGKDTYDGTCTFKDDSGKEAPVAAN